MLYYLIFLEFSGAFTHAGWKLRSSWIEEDSLLKVDIIVEQKLFRLKILRSLCTTPKVSLTTPLKLHTSRWSDWRTWLWDRLAPKRWYDTADHVFKTGAVLTDWLVIYLGLIHTSCQRTRRRRRNGLITVNHENEALARWKSPMQTDSNQKTKTTLMSLVGSTVESLRSTPLIVLLQRSIYVRLHERWL